MTIYGKGCISNYRNCSLSYVWYSVLYRMLTQQGMVLFIVISCCDIVCWFKTTTSYGESAPLAVQLAPLIFRTTSLIKLFDTHHSLSILAILRQSFLDYSRISHCHTI